MATTPNEQATLKAQPLNLPDTGDQNIKIGYSATIIDGMGATSGMLLEDLMDYLRKHHEQVFNECRDQYDALSCCLSVIRDHAGTIQKITG